MVSGSNDLAPAEDAENENPSLVALGKKLKKVNQKVGKSRPKNQKVNQKLDFLFEPWLVDLMMSFLLQYFGTFIFMIYLMYWI